METKEAAARETASPSLEKSVALARKCADLLDAKRMTDIVIFDVRDQLQITDFFVLASGTNSRQLKSACDHLDKEIAAGGVRRVGLEGYREGKWVLVDFVEVVVHLFLEENRRYYDLELLWGDCPRLVWSPPPRPEP
ncbi:MAG: ribosome silencing factor [Planctomycetes bacterium]|nr:ribosome silencing factor [Planctomycetota bacterium]